MINVITLRPEPNYFGDCPHCGRTSGFFNLGREQWCYCVRHQTRWNIGSNVLSSWRTENQEIWRINYYRFARYRQVEPSYRKAQRRGVAP